MPLTEGFGNATFVWELAGDAEAMTYSMGFSCSDTSAAGLAQAAQDLYDAFRDEVVITDADILAGWTFVRYEWEANPVGAAPIEGAIGVNLPGVDAAGSIPINGALLVRKLSGLAGRANRGRMFVPPYGLGEEDVTQAGYIDPTALITAQSLYTNWLDVFEATTVGNVMVIHHADPLVTPTPISNLEVDNRIATQRRRLR